MKKILFSIVFLASLFNSFAQLTCATAIPITTNSTINVPQITGTYPGLCWKFNSRDFTGPNAIWYRYTASTNGEVTINADLPQNVSPYSTDQRVTIAIGTSCTTLTCYGAQDDISSNNFHVNYTFPVSAGTTYYIIWDDRWDSNGFVFNFSFNPVSCVRPSDTCVLPPTNITDSSATLSWTPAIGSPASYQVYLPSDNVVFDTNSNSVSITNIYTEDSVYYLSSICSNWSGQQFYAGPFPLYLAVSLPYSNNFDFEVNDNFLSSSSFTTHTNPSQSWSLVENWGVSQAHSGTKFYISSSSTTSATNKYLFSRAIKLQANEQVNMTFYTSRGPGTQYTPQVLKVLVNNIPSENGAIQIGSNITITESTYRLQTVSYEAPSEGIYYFIFNNATPISVYSTPLYLDTVNMTSVLGIDDFEKDNYEYYVDPLNNVVNFKNNNLILKIILFDLLGQKIYEKDINSLSGQFDINKFETGIYLLKFVTENTHSTVKIYKD